MYRMIDHIKFIASSFWISRLRHVWVMAWFVVQLIIVERCFKSTLNHLSFCTLGRCQFCEEDPVSNQYGNEFSIDTCLKRAPNPSAWPLSTHSASIKDAACKRAYKCSQTASSLSLKLQVRGSAKHGHGHPTADADEYRGTPTGSPPNKDGIGLLKYEEHQISQRLLEISQLPM